MQLILLLIPASVLAVIAVVNLVRSGVLKPCAIPIIVGGVGIAVAVLNLSGNGSSEVMVGIMLSGSVLAGCGTIAAAISQKTE